MPNFVVVPAKAGTQGNLPAQSPQRPDELMGSGRNESLVESARSSCAGLTRVSTSSFEREGVDARGTSPWAEGHGSSPADTSRKARLPQQLLKTAMRANREIGVILA
jgi:hypothetical protein